MTREEKIMILKSRLNHIISRGKYKDCPGVYRKVERQIKKLERNDG